MEVKPEISNVIADVSPSSLGFDQTNLKVTQETEKIERQRER